MVLVEIEEYSKQLRPDIEVSSGRSGITNTLTKDLWQSVYLMMLSIQKEGMSSR